MKKSVVTMFVCFFATAQQVVSVDVEAIMYVDTEMPCFENVLFSGKIVIRNNGDEVVQLLKGSPAFPEMLVFDQLHLYPDMPIQEIRTFYAKPERVISGEIDRYEIKENIDYQVNRGEFIVTLKKGESFEVKFGGREIGNSDFRTHAFMVRKRIPFAATLYLPPDMWIPVKVHPPISIAYDAKSTSLTPIETGPEWDRTSVRLTRVQIGTNEFLHAKLNSAVPFLRLADLHPDDVVVHSNKVITITQKNGKVRTIPEADIPRISAERAEEKRKAREKEMGGN